MNSTVFDPLLLWGLFTRSLGLVYALAFASLLLDARGWIGACGVLPVADRLARIRSDFPGFRRFLYFPTLLWAWGVEDRRLQALLGAGLVASGFVMCGIMSQPALLVCWLVLLSFDIAYDLTYPWECLLLESGFLALFLPALHPLPALAATAPPLPLIAWSFRLLLFRVLLGFGKTKFTRAALGDLDYLRSFFIVQPLPTPLAWWGFHCPRWVLRTALSLMFLVEIVLPFFIFVEGASRIVVAVAVLALMVGIQLTGNYGYFNVLMLVMCLPLLDTQAALSDQTYSLEAVLVGAVVSLHLIGCLLNFPVNNWVARNWLYWPNWREVRVPGLQRLVAFYRALSPFRLVHAYGIFPPKLGPALRYVPIIECSDDGSHFQRWPTRYISTAPHEPLRFFAPRFPRLDHTLFYEAALLQATNEFAPLVAPGHPYSYSTVCTLQRIAQRLTETDSPVAKLLGPCPLRGRVKAVRVRTAALIPTSPTERAQTGALWHEFPAGELVAATEGNEWLMKHALPAPALFAWDEQVWRDRTPALARVQGGVAPSGANVDAMWSEYLPLTLRARGDFRQLHETRNVIGQTLSPAQRRAHQHTLRLLCAALGARLQPHFLGQREPRLALPSWYHVGMLTQHVLGEGRAAYEAALSDPERAISAAGELTLETGLLFDALERFDVLAWHVRSVRRTERASGEQATMAAPGIPGFASVLPELMQRLPVHDNHGCAPLCFRREPTGWQRVE